VVLVVFSTIRFKGESDMRQSWQDWDRSADKGPFSLLLRAMIGLIILGVIVGVIGYSLGWFGEAGKVAQDEFGPKAVLLKYEWFKDTAAQLEKKQADIAVFERRIKQQDEAYKGTSRKDWPRDEREQRSVWESEVSGVKASYNGLAADYNSQMAKFNWRFANVGELPKGAENPLPREFKSYVSQ